MDRIKKIKKDLGIPLDTDEWHYVLVEDITKATNWIKDNKVYYWEYCRKGSREFKSWPIRDLEKLYQNRDWCFRFSNEDHAVLFKLTCG